jgi:hypothetical protein
MFSIYPSRITSIGLRRNDLLAGTRAAMTDERTAMPHDKMINHGSIYKSINAGEPD